jgi:hypothetical protein
MNDHELNAMVTAVVIVDASAANERLCLWALRGSNPQPTD